MKKEILKQNFEKACVDYIEYFCKKQDMYFEFWVADEVGGVACFGDYFFNLTDIILDIESEQPAELILDWQNEISGQDPANGKSVFINYRSYIKGLRLINLEGDWDSGNGSHYK